MLGGIVEQGNAAGTTTKARMQQAHEDAVRNITNTLSSRGLLRSGEAGYQFGREGKEYDIGNFDAVQKLLDYLGGVQSAFNQSEQQRQRELRGGAESAYDRQLQLAQLAGGYGRGARGGPGGSGGRGLQWQGISRENLSAAGYSDEEIANAIYSTMAERGWGPYYSGGGWNDPSVKDDGQIKEDSGGRYISVKIGYADGPPSTEKIYLSPPASQQQQPPPAPTAPPPPAPPPPPQAMAPPAPVGINRLAGFRKSGYQ